MLTANLAATTHLANDAFLTSFCFSPLPAMDNFPSTIEPVSSGATVALVVALLFLILCDASSARHYETRLY